MASSAQDISLVELVDRLLDKGVVLQGDVVLSVADVDLLYVGLRLVVASVESLGESDLAKLPQIAQTVGRIVQQTS